MGQRMRRLVKKKREKLTAVGFEPTQLALVELESTPLDHSGKLSMAWLLAFTICPFVAVSQTGRVGGRRLRVFQWKPSGARRR